jgi:hypothetical protein
MTTTTKAAGNGSTPSTTPAARKRLTGMARVREAEAWHTASVMQDAAYEAERLCTDIYHAVSDAYQPSQGDSTAAELAASPGIRDKAREARRCLLAAVGYLDTLVCSNGESPF